MGIVGEQPFTVAVAGGTRPRCASRMRAALMYGGVAALMAAGAAMPVLQTTGDQPPQLVFPLLQVMADPSAAWLTKIWCAYPLFAAMALILTACRARDGVRAFLMHVLALVPFAAYYSGAAIQPALTHPLGLPEEFDLLLPFGGALAMAGVVLLYAGSRVHARAPENTAAALAGALGGVYYLVSLAVPVESTAMGTYAALAPFKMMFEEQGSWARQIAGGSRLLTMLLLAAAAVIALQNLAPRPGAEVRARVCLRLWQAHFALLLAAPCAVLWIVSARAATPATTVPADLLLTAKSMAAMLGYVLLLLMGASELLAAATRRA